MLPCGLRVGPSPRIAVWQRVDNVVPAWSHGLDTMRCPRLRTGDSINEEDSHLKTIYRALLGSALALPLAIGPAFAADEMEEGTKIACTEMKYSAEFLAKYPDAPAACVEAVDKDGKRYAKFQAKVFLNSKDRTTVELLNVRGDPLTTFSFKPAPDAGVMIDGKKTKFTDLKKGEKISFYVSEDRLTASEQPGSTEESWAVLPPQ